MSKYICGAFIRGKYIEENLITFGGRGAGVEFLAPDPATLIDALPLGDPLNMSDLYELTFDDIVDFLKQLKERLAFNTNTYMQQAFEASLPSSGVTEPLLKSQYEGIPAVFHPDVVREMAEKRIGINYLDGWVDTPLNDGRVTAIRAFGARTLHIPAGNSPFSSVFTILRNTIIRSDAIIKAPSNDPYTALGIVRTMQEMAPDHPLTKHISVAYWKGGDEAFEKRLYQPHNVEKIVAWGGFAALKHVTKYIQPGLELISLDPKRSISIIGPEAFADDASLRMVANRLAADIGTYNQEGCVSARVIYAACGTGEEGVEQLKQFGQYVYDAMLNLPPTISSKPKNFNPTLKANVQAAALQDEWYHVIGGNDDEGAIIVSLIPDPVEFSTTLVDRVANIVPVDSIKEVYAAVDAYTQTVGVYPDSLKTELRDRLALHGAQRVVSLGYAPRHSLCTPQDSIEPLRRMCKWIMDETCDPAKIPPIWEGSGSIMCDVDRPTLVMG